MREIKHIVIHCTAGKAQQKTSDIINYWKYKLGWKSYGYHWLVDADGTANRLTEDYAPTNGVKGYNATSINISYKGGGGTGTNGWTPILALVTDGERRVLQVTDWTGGTGTKPTSGLYVGATGLVADIALAVDIRGAQGEQGGDLNIYNSDGTIDANRTVGINDKYLIIGDLANDITQPNYVSGYGKAIGNIEAWTNGNLPFAINSSIEKWILYSIFCDASFNVRAFGDGIFIASGGTSQSAEPETVISGTTIGDTNIASISVYPENGFGQMGRCAAQFNKATGEGYGMICMASDFDYQKRNYFSAFNDKIKGRYYHSTTGEELNLLVDDNGLTINKGTTEFVKVDYDGNLQLSNATPANNWRFRIDPTSGDLLIQRFDGTNWITKQSLI